MGRARSECLRGVRALATLGGRRYRLRAVVAPAIRLFPDDARIGLIGIRFLVELRAEGVDPLRPSTWPAIDGRIEFVGGRLLYMPPRADYQQDVAMDVAYVLRSWSEQRPDFIVGGNEAGMKLGGDIRAADRVASSGGQPTNWPRPLRCARACRRSCRRG